MGSLLIEAPRGGLAARVVKNAHPHRGAAESFQRPDLPDKVVKSAGRVLQILEFFDSSRTQASVIDVARALRMPQSSTSVLLRSLTLMGYLDYDAHVRCYRPTSRVAILGNWVNPLLVQRGGVLDAMREMSAETGLSVVLAARNGLNAQYIHVVHPEGHNPCQPTIGTTRPLAISAVGHIFLSLLPDLEVGKLIRRMNAYAAPDERIVRLPDLLDRLEETRCQGFAYSTSAHTAGGATLAMQVPSEPTALVVGLSGPRERIEAERETLAEMLREQLAGLTSRVRRAN